MKFITVFFVCVVVLTATAYPQSRSNNKLKNKPKSSRQDLAPATPTPPALDKVVVSQNTSQVLTIASNSTPSVILSTEAPKAGAADSSSAVPPPASVVTTVTTVAPPKSTTVAPKAANATTTAKPDEDDEDDEDSSEEEEDADVDSDVEEGDFGGPPGPPPGGPDGPEGDLEFGSDEDEDEEEDDDDRAADQSSSETVQKPSKKNKKGVNQEAKIRETSGGIDAYVPGYVTDQGEVLVPIDTLERGLQYTIISDRFVSIPQKKSHSQRNPVYLYRQEPSPAKPASQPDVEESSEEDAPPEVFPVKKTETSVIFATKAPPANDTQKEEQISGNSSQSSESQEDEDDQSPIVLKTSEPEVNPPLGVVPATRPTGEDDEEEVVGTRRSDNRVYRRNFYHPSRHFAYSPQFDYMNNLQDNRRVVSDPYPANFYRSYGRAQPLRYNRPYGDVVYEDSLEDFGRSDFEDY